MTPSPFRRRAGVSYLPLAAIVLFGGLIASWQTSALALARIKSTSQQKKDQARTVSVSFNQDLAKTIKLAEVYAHLAHTPPTYSEPILTRGASGIAVFRNASPAVVLIFVGEVKNDHFEPTGLGSGVVVSATGDILTNWHVTDGYAAAVIFFKPQGSADIANSKAYVATVVAQSEMSDLALLHLTEAPPTRVLVPLGNISSVQVAQDIHVIGHPKGKPWSYSTGVVSQIRDGYDWTYEDGSKHQAKVLQLQTAINPGNSGGPVLDDQGRLIGLIAMSEEGQNLDYAIAADVIQSFVSSATAVGTPGRN